MTVTAAVTESKDAPFALQELELDEPRVDEVLVEIDAVGICHTDLSVRAALFDVPMPVVLGHEGTGRVKQVGAGVRKVAPGDRVALSFNSCGTCRGCHRGRPSTCAAFWPLNFGAARPDGTSAFRREGAPVHSHFFGQSSFATQVVSPQRSVAKIADDIPAEVVAPFGCGIQTGAGTVMNALRPPPGSSIAVFGVGGVGMAAVMAAQIVGCGTVIAVDLNDERLRLARELGATETVNAGEQDPVEAIQALTGGAGADYCVECSGGERVLPQAIMATVAGGTTAIVGAPPLGVTADVDVNAMLAFSRTLRGVVEGESVIDVFIPELIEHWRRGRFPVERLVKAFDFDQIDEASERAESGDVIKPVLKVR